MRAISLWQPWSQLVAVGAKTVETRGKSTPYRGPLAIHAAKRKPEWSEDEKTRQKIDTALMTAGYCSSKDYGRRGLDRTMISINAERHGLPLGAIVATCELVDCVEMTRHKFLDIDFLSLGDAWDDRIYDDLHSRETFRDEFYFGNYAAGRFAWILKDIRKLEKPIPCVGRQWLFEWTPPVDPVSPGRVVS